MHTGFNFIEQFVPCECCGPKYTSCTVTTHKWTKKEVEHELLMLSIEGMKNNFRCAACDGAKTGHTQCCVAIDSVLELIKTK